MSSLMNSGTPTLVSPVDLPEIAPLAREISSQWVDWLLAQSLDSHDRDKMFNKNSAVCLYGNISSRAGFEGNLTKGTITVQS